MTFFIETVKPYNFSYYTLRLGSKAEMKEIVMSCEIINSKSLTQLIFRSASHILVFNNHNEKGAINVYEDLDTKPTIDVFKLIINNWTISDCFSSIIGSFALPFVVLNENDFYVCLSRIKDDVCNFYGCFFVNKGDKEQIMKIFTNPGSLLQKYEIVSENSELTEDQKIAAKDKLQKYVKQENSNKLIQEDGKEKVQEEKTRNITENDIASLQTKSTIQNTSEDLSTYNEMQDTTINPVLKCQIIEIEPVRGNGTKMVKNTKLIENKAFENLTETQKKKVNAEISKLKEVKNLENKEVEVQSIDDSKDTIKYGRFLGNKLKIESKKLDYMLTIKNYDQLKAILIILILNMKLNNYDIIEVRSEIDVFLMKYGDDVVVFIHDQVSREDTAHVGKLCKLRAEIQTDMKVLH